MFNFFKKNHEKIFLKAFKKSDKTINNLKSGTTIKFMNQIYILFYCDEPIKYSDLPNNRKDWYLYNMNTRIIERVHPYNDYIITQHRERSV